MDLEPMDVDKSASSTSKMDISFNDADSDIYIVDKGGTPTYSPTNITVNKEVPESKINSISRFSNFGGLIKKENPEFIETLSTTHNNLTHDNNIATQEEALTKMDDTEVKPQKRVKPLKTYHIKKQQLKEKTSLKFMFLVIGVVMLLSSIVIYQIMNFHCTENIDLETLRKSYSKNLIGQSDASNKLIDSLNTRDQRKIIFLYGGTGVGKTFAMSLILDIFWNAANMYHYTMPTFADSFSPELMLGLTICKTSILIVDDLTRNDMHITSHIKSVVAKSTKLGKNITVFLVYNCDNVTDNFVKKCDYYSFRKELELNFSDIDVKKYFVDFQPLQQEHLKKCIERELGNRKVSLQTMNNILKNFDVSLDGCKGVYMKIKFLNII